MKKLSERIKDWLYLSHVFVISIGGLYQLVHIFYNKSAGGFTLAWVLCLLYAELVALPRSLSSNFWVWKTCHIVGAILMTALVVGVILYS